MLTLLFSKGHSIHILLRDSLVFRPPVLDYPRTTAYRYKTRTTEDEVGPLWRTRICTYLLLLLRVFRNRMYCFFSTLQMTNTNFAFTVCHVTTTNVVVSH